MAGMGIEREPERFPVLMVLFLCVVTLFLFGSRAGADKDLVSVKPPRDMFLAVQQGDKENNKPPPHRRIVVGGDHNYPPFEFLDEHGRPAGYNVELTRAIARQVGLDIEIRLGPWKKIQQELAWGEIDAISGMLYSPERDEIFDFTPPHTVNHNVSVVRTGEGVPPASVDALTGKRIVVQQGDIMHDYAKKNGFRDHLVSVDSQEDALRQLSGGRHDVALVSRLTALYCIEKYGWKNLVVGRQPLLSSEYCFAVPQNHKALLTQLGDGLKVLDENGEYRRIQEKWMGIYQGFPYNPIKVLRHIAMGALPLLLLVFAFFLWSWSLRKQVARRTAELRKSEEQFRLLADNTLDVIWTMNLELEFTYINPACYTFTGYTPQEWIGSRLSEHCDEENFANAVRVVGAETDKGPQAGGVIFETVIFDKKGRAVPVEIHGKAIYDENDQPIGLQGVARDISERKQAEQSLLRSEALLNTAERISGIGGWQWDVDRREMFWTEQTYRIHDFDPDPARLNGQEHIARSIECYSQEDRPRILSAFQRCVDEGKAYELECRFTTAKGRRLWIRTTGQAVREGDRIVQVAGYIQDITEQKQAGEALRYQDRLLREMGGIAKIGGWEFDPATGKGTWTEQVARIHGLEPAGETSLECVLSFYTGESREKIEAAIKEAVAEGKSYDLVLELVAAKGDRKWIRTIGQPKIENGQVVQVRGSFQDISERKQAKDRIEHLNRVLRAIRSVNQLIVHERDPETLIRRGCRVLVENRGYTSAIIVLTDNENRPFSWVEAGIQEPFGPLAALLQQGMLPPCFDQAGSAGNVIVVHDRKVVCSRCPVADVYSDIAALCVRLVHGGMTFGYLAVSVEHGRMADADEQALFAEMAGDLAYALNSLQMAKAHQESERKSESLEKKLVQAQKMESVGRLAGGVAHDYNNMLSVIIGYAELALDKVAPDHSLHCDLTEIVRAANRSADITRQLLAFARRQTIAPKVLDLNETVESMLKMLRRLIGEDIDLAWLPGAKLHMIKIDPVQVDQILANLCVNARDAISGVGKVTIETDNTSFDESYCADHAGFVPGDFVLLAVSDDGIGMDPKTLDKVFEPFFTTKGLGKGTGLGLATVYGIVKQNNGFINVYSEPGTGTTIRIYLPACAHRTIDQPDRHVPVPVSRGETVLLVEDEQSILIFGKRLLESLGYVVLDAGTPGEAMRLAQAHAGKIHLLVTDVVMPEMNGRELADRLAALQPDLKVLFMSGYTANVIAHRGVLDEGVQFIQKPFSNRDLAAKVRAALD